MEVSSRYSFGMAQPGRTFTGATGYEYGFNNMRRDDEWTGTASAYDFGSRIYDSRAARFLSVDVLRDSFPTYSPYLFAGNKPISHIDKDGEREFLVIVNINPAGGFLVTVSADVRNVTSPNTFIFRYSPEGDAADIVNRTSLSYMLKSHFEVNSQGFRYQPGGQKFIYPMGIISSTRSFVFTPAVTNNWAGVFSYSTGTVSNITDVATQVFNNINGQMQGSTGPGANTSNLTLNITVAPNFPGRADLELAITQMYREAGIEVPIINFIVQDNFTNGGGTNLDVTVNFTWQVITPPILVEVMPP